MDRVLGIYGAGGLGREILELAEQIDPGHERWDRIVFVNNGDPAAPVHQIEVISEEIAAERYKAQLDAVVATGEPALRARICHKLRTAGIPMVTLIHPGVHIPASTEIGEGVTIETGAVISVDVRIGANTHIYANTVIAHDCRIGEHCVICAGTQLSGDVVLGDRSFVGFGSGVKQGLRIGADVIIGGGSAVFHDVPDETVVMGNPARVIRRNEAHRVFG
ncbi:MAG: acetyltransferase [Butyrivibrio sp.]|nr:acetyltransferase [Butyrivibrio sp.]